MQFLVASTCEMTQCVTNPSLSFSFLYFLLFLSLKPSSWHFLCCCTDETSPHSHSNMSQCDREQRRDKLFLADTQHRAYETVTSLGGTTSNVENKLPNDKRKTKQNKKVEIVIRE